MQIKTTMAVVFVVLLCSAGVAVQETKPDAKAVVEQTLATYQSLNSLRISGEAFADMKMPQGNFKIENTFTIDLARPGKYLVSWDPKGAMAMMPKGAVWNAGQGPFLYMGSGNMYMPMSDNMMALSAATGISSGAANTIPSLFFNGKEGFTPSALALLENCRYSGEETLNNEVCQVITASSKVSKKHTLWISKERHVLLKQQYALGGENSPDFAGNLKDEDVKEAAKKLGGGEQGEELANRTAETAKVAAEMMKNIDAVMGETYTTVELNPKLADSDLTYQVPADATKQASFFDAMGAMQQSAASRYNQQLKVGDTVPDFTGTRLDGTDLKLADYRGKVVLLDFWATWCPPCVAALPGVVKTYEKYGKQGLNVIGISLDESKDDLTAFLKKHEGMQWPILFDGESWQGKIARAYGVEAIPFTLLIDGQGVVRGRDLEGAKLDEAVEALLTQKK